MRAQASYTIVHVKDGNDLDGILMLWKKTTSNIAPSKPNGTNLNGWTEEMPEFESGAYVWTCNRVVISDPTAATPIYIYTDPVLDTHWQKLDEVYKQGTEIKNTVDNITLKYSNSNGEETSFKLTNGAIDITLLKNQVDAAATTATNFISMRGDGGIEVGKRNGEGWSGYRSQMLADSFNIVNEDGTVLASYGANKISLGLDSEDSEIVFNGGSGSLYAHDANGNRGMYFSSGYFDVQSTDRIRLYSHGFGSTAAGSQHFYESHLMVDVNSISGYGTARLVEDISIWQFGIGESSVHFNDGYGNEFRTGSSGITLTAPNVSVSGRIRGTAEGVSWFRGREAATLIVTGGAGASAYYPVIDTRCNTGDWSIGTLGDSLYFVYTTDSNYNAGNNTTTRVGVDYNGAFFSGLSYFKNGYAHIYGTTGGGDMWFRSTNSTNGHSIGFGVGSSGEARGFYDVGRAQWTLYNSSTWTQLQAPGALYFIPYYGTSTNSSSRYFAIGITNTSYGPCFRPDTNGWGTIGTNGIGVKYIYATNTGIQSTSDIRLKENISDDFSSLEKLFEMLRPVTYEYKHLKDDNDVRIGFIAQDVWSALESCGYDPRRFAAIHAEEVDPESDLKEYIDTDETYYLNYTEFTALNTYMIQKLMKRIEELEKRIA